MNYTDLIFDLYGTLVDIHTREDAQTWEKTALFFAYYGADYSGAELEQAFGEAMAARQAQAGASYECFPDIPVESVMAELFRAKGIREKSQTLGFQAAQVFRISSTDYLRLYPGVLPALEALAKAGCRLWLLSNAQRAFTAYELRALGLGKQLDGIYLSSDYGCRKPDPRFYQALLRERGLDIANCLMIGNDRQTDIAGAMALGMDTVYLHTNLTPADQRPADPAKGLDLDLPHREFEGWDWEKLTSLLLGTQTP